MELRQLRTFRTVATLLSFHRAADALNYAQSTISAQIKSLEEELGVRLFDRLGKRIILTNAGELLFQYAQKMLDMEAETLSEVKGRAQPQGSLTIRVPQTIGSSYLPQVLAEFRKEYPLVGFDFNTCAFHGLEHELQTGVTDLAFLLAESIQSASLIAEPLRFERILMVCDPGNPLADKSPVVTEELSDQSVFLAKADCGYRMVFEQILAAKNVRPAAILEFNSVDMLKACLKRSSGVAVIPEITVRRELDRRELSIVRWDESYVETAILMIRHRDKWLSPALEAFMKSARAVIR